MAKILIASLGKGDKNGKYLKANYIIDGKIYENRSFITSALKEHFNIDKSIYIGTVGSMWDSLYEYYCQKHNIEEDQEYRMELLTIMEKANKNSSFDEINIEKFHNDFGDEIKIILTKYGMNTEEIFENFNFIMEIGEELKDGDEIYLDITHSFRSNAMWMFLVMNYIMDVLDKKIELKMISYGMFEAKYEEEINNEKIILSPIVDLKAFFDLLKWIKAANEIKKYGNAYGIIEMLDNETEISKKIEAFSDSLNLNYVATIKRNIESIKKIREKILMLTGPAKLIIPNVVNEFILRFENINENYRFLFELAKWHYEQKRYGLVAININECIREMIANLLGIEDRGEDWKKGDGEILNALEKIKRNNPKYKGSFDKKSETIYKIFEHTRKIRNEISHSIGGKDTAINDVNSLKNYIETLEKLTIDKEFIKYLKSLII